MTRCHYKRCLKPADHNGRHWYGSPQRTPYKIDDLAAVHDLVQVARREALRLVGEGVRLREEVMSKQT